MKGDLKQYTVSMAPDVQRAAVKAFKSKGMNFSTGVRFLIIEMLNKK